MSMNVLSDLLGCAELPWIILAQNSGSSRWIACSSYATKKEAKERCTSNNRIMFGRIKYKVLHRDELPIKEK